MGGQPESYHLTRSVFHRPPGAVPSRPAQASSITAGNRDPRKHASACDLALAMEYRRRIASPSDRVASVKESVPGAVAAHAARETPTAWDACATGSYCQSSRVKP